MSQQSQTVDYDALAQQHGSDSQTKSEPSVGQRLRQNFAEGIGVTDDEGAKKFFEHPIDTLMTSFENQGALALKAREAYKNGDYKGALMYGMNYLVPFIGQQTAKAGEQLNEGDYAGGIGRTLGVAAPIIAGSSPVRSVAGKVTAPVAPFVKSAVAKTAGVASDIVDPEITGIVSPRLAHVQKVLGKLSDAMEKSQKMHSELANTDDVVYPGAPLPEKPPIELLQARALEDGAKPVIDPSAGLGKLPVAAPEPSVYPGAPLPASPNPALLQARSLEHPGSTPPEPPSAALGKIPVRAPEPEPTPVPPTTEETQPEVSSPPQPPSMRRLSGDSALRQILTGQDNANLLKIAKSRGVNVTREAQLRPGLADNMLVNKIIDDMSPEELDEIGDKYAQNRSRHKFGDIGPEAWKTMSLQTYFPDMKIPATVLKRTGQAIDKAAASSPVDDLTTILQKSLEAAKSSKKTGATQ